MVKLTYLGTSKENPLSKTTNSYQRNKFEKKQNTIQLKGPINFGDQLLQRKIWQTKFENKTKGSNGKHSSVMTYKSSIFNPATPNNDRLLKNWLPNISISIGD